MVTIILALLGLAGSIVPMFLKKSPVAQAAVPTVVTALSNAVQATQSTDPAVTKNHVMAAIGAAAATGQIVGTGGTPHTMDEVIAALPEISAMYDEFHAAITSTATTTQSAGPSGVTEQSTA